jgi:hypothetical protein
MKKLVFISALFILAMSFASQSQNLTPMPGRGAIIEFKDNSHDFGTIDESTRATYEFEFTNTGDSVLILREVRASCGCTAPTWPRQPIKPGEKGKITVVYNSTGYGGQNFHKSVTVTTNMKQDNVKILYIKGKVNPKAAVQPDNQNSPIKINQN